MHVLRTDAPQLHGVFEFRPAGETVFARDAGLHVVQPQIHRRERRIALATRRGKVRANAFERLGVGLLIRAQQIFSLLAQMVEVRPFRKWFHENLHA
jgi:hypothetical protein